MNVRWLVLGPALMIALPGCADDATIAAEPTGETRGVTQGGPADIARFRSVVDARGVPSLDLLDPVGFFAEHALDLPGATCEEPICVHAQLAVAPRFNGANWTMAYATLRSAVDPATRARGPVHLIAAVDQSGHVPPEMQQAYHAALSRLEEGLHSDDRVSLVTFAYTSEAPVTLAPPTNRTLSDALRAPQYPYRHANLYAGLSEAAALAEADGAHTPRIVLITSGHADLGIADSERIVAFGEEVARRGVRISVVGVGADYDAELPSRLGDLGAGTYAYAEDEADLVDVLAQEAEFALVPLATDFTLTVTPSSSYRVGRIYGARRAVRQQGSAVLSSPALFLGARAAAADTTLGRRGGGGGLFVELLARTDAEPVMDQPAFTVTAAYVDALEGTPITVGETLTNTLAPGENPAENWPVFTAPAHAKPFMMLNMYLALRGTVDFYSRGDCARALGLVDMMRPAIELWQAEYDDPDIDADSELLQRLGMNIEVGCRLEPVPVPDFDGGCFGL